MYAQGNRYLGPFTVNAGQVLEIGTYVLPRADTIHGVVTDATGTLVVGAKVSIRGLTPITAASILMAAMRSPPMPWGNTVVTGSPRANSVRSVNPIFDS